MVKTPPFHGGNMGSNPVGVIKLNSVLTLSIAVLAQLVEHRYRKPRVTGSNPADGTNKGIAKVSWRFLFFVAT